MKKLLSILGAVTLAASSSATVVACGDKKEPEENVEPEFDYDKTLKQFIADVKGALENNISKAFKDYAFIGDDTLPNDLKLSDLQKAIDDKELENKDSDINKLFVKFITNIIPTAQIDRDIKTILNNVNYNQVIVDKDSPLKEGYIVQDIKGVKKGNNVTINAKIYVSIAYKDELGQPQKDSHLINIEISVFEKKDELVLADTLADIYEKAFNEKYANNFKITSNKGFLDDTAKKINTDETIKKLLDDIFKDIEKDYKEEDPQGQLTLDYSGSTIASEPTQLITASRNTRLTNAANALKPSSQKGIDLAMALGDEEGGVYENEFINKVVKAESDDYARDWYLTDEDYYKEMMEAIEKKSSISKNINQYHLNYNYQLSSLKKALDAQNSKFEINLESNYKSIALVGAKIKGMKFSLGAHTYNLQNVSVAVQQETTHFSTEKLYDAFINDAFHYQKALGNFQKTFDSGVVKPVYDAFVFETSVSKDDLLDKIITPASFESAIFNQNEKANEYAEKLGLNSRMVYDVISAKAIYINAQGYIYALSPFGSTYMTYSNGLTTNFYGSDNVDFGETTFGFTFGQYYSDQDKEDAKDAHPDYPVKDFPNSPYVVLKNATWSKFKIKFNETPTEQFGK